MRQTQSDCHPDKNHRDAQSARPFVSQPARPRSSVSAITKLMLPDTRQCHAARFAKCANGFHAARRSRSTWRSHPSSWFQLVKFWVTTAFTAISSFSLLSSKACDAAWGPCGDPAVPQRARHCAIRQRSGLETGTPLDEANVRKAVKPLHAGNNESHALDVLAPVGRAMRQTEGLRPWTLFNSLQH
jgi:hypothetical protein